MKLSPDASVLLSIEDIAFGGDGVARLITLSYSFRLDHISMRVARQFLFSVLCVGMLLVGCSREPTGRGELDQEFQAEYGFPPPSGVAELRCRVVRVGDTWSKWMLFTYDQATVERIVSVGFTNAMAEDLKRPWEALWSQDLTASQQNPNAPKWFRLPGDRPARIYYKLGHPNDVAGYSYIWIDDTNKTVFAKSAAWH